MAKSSLHKCEDPSSIPSYHTGNPWKCASVISAQETQKQMNPWGSLASYPSSTGEP